jgi:hypothetical protein
MGRAALALGLLIAVSALPVPVQASDSVILRLPAGSGPGAVGLAAGAEDAEPSGPNAISIGEDGSVLLLDQLNGRILSLGGGRSTAPEVFALPDGVEPTDMAVVKGRLYVFDGEPMRLDSANGSRALSARAAEPDDAYARSVLAQTGSVVPGPIEEALDGVGRSAEQPPRDPVVQFVPTAGEGEVMAEVIIAPDEREATLLLRRQGEETPFRELHLGVQDRLGSVELLEIDDNGRAFVSVENVPGDLEQAADVAVVRFSDTGRMEARYEVPSNAEGPPVRRPVAISRSGDVFGLRSGTDAVEVLRLEARPLEAGRAMSGPGEVGGRTPPPPRIPPRGNPPALPTPPGAAPGPITATLPTTRARVVETAFGFEKLRWLVTRNAYGADPDDICDGFANRIRRPRFVQQQLGKSVQGMPYCWGCKTSPSGFIRRVNAGAKAGNVCTRRDPRRDTAGVDCSSFVSEAWGLAAHITTRAMAQVTRVLADPWSLRPGDALNKPGAHVVLFLRFTPDRKIEVLEASPGGCPGRVCRNVYPLGQFISRGFVPIRYRAIQD